MFSEHVLLCVLFRNIIDEALFVLLLGPGVRSNNSLEETYVSNLDVVPTVLNAIGVEKSELMRGRVLEEIYV